MDKRLEKFEQIKTNETRYIICFKDNNNENHFWCGYSKYSSDVLDAQFYKTTRNATHQAEWVLKQKNPYLKLISYEILEVSIDKRRYWTQGCDEKIEIKIFIEPIKEDK